MKKYLVWFCAVFLCERALAHPMPGSVVSLSILDNCIRGEAKIPLIELGNAVGNERIANMADPFFRTYFINHIQAASGANRWNTQIETITIDTNKDPLTGTYQEVLVRFLLTPPGKHYLHTFAFSYDAVIHQVVTHSALVYVNQDWSNGVHDEASPQQIGIIKLDVPTEKIYPLQINLEAGSWWKGAKSMFNLGMQHIREGTDHLLFLMVLLLPAMLLTKGRQWGGYGGVRYSLSHLLKIVTAFTAGHSITLLAGALGWLRLPGQPVEILIGVSILVSAIHAVRPLFPGKETYIAAGFGLVHGLAFATVLARLELTGTRLALSVLGFNLGIEVMQLAVIAIMVPWFILLSRTATYTWVRTIGAVLAAVAALAWIAERTTGKANFITGFMELVTPYAGWVVAAMAVVSLGTYVTTARLNRKTKPFFT